MTAIGWSPPVLERHAVVNTPASGPWTASEVASLVAGGARVVVSPPVTIDVRATTEAWTVREGAAVLTPHRPPTLTVDDFDLAYGDAFGSGVGVMATVTAGSVDAFAATVSRIARLPVASVQLDFSATNADDGRSFGYQWALLEQVLRGARARLNVPLGARLPAMWDMTSIETLSLILVRVGADFVTAITDLRIGLVVEHDTEHDTEHEAGAAGRPWTARIGQLGGRAILPLALANVRMFYETLGTRIPIVGSGGVADTADAIAFLLAGAHAVESGDGDGATVAEIRDGVARWSDDVGSGVRAMVDGL